MDLKLLRRSTVYDGRVFTIEVDDIEYPSGRRSVREVARHGGGAVVLAVDAMRNALLIRQLRYPLDEFLWELPAGKLNRGEDPLDCARRELGEETGYQARKWSKLTAIYTSPGFCSEHLHIFLAEEISPRPEGRAPEEGEETMTVTSMPLDEAVAMVERNEIVDAKSICGILLGERILRARNTP
ncbi:MAG TPA: NUDIX hydrolase [Bacteroidota bacterium]|nr:NUDIX hydrolase [Bacteroidota bacterium]